METTVVDNMTILAETTEPRTDMICKGMSKDKITQKWLMRVTQTSLTINFLHNYLNN